MMQPPIQGLEYQAADYLVGRQLPDVALPSTSGESISLPEYSLGRWVLFIYPRTSVPGEAGLDGWENIPGAKGCTAEACSFRDHIAELKQAGAEKVAGLSVQSAGFQQEASERLHLPYPLLSDEDRRFAEALQLPTFEVSDYELLQRMTLILDGSTISHVFYPVHPVEGHVEHVRHWLHSNPRRGDSGISPS